MNVKMAKKHNNYFSMLGGLVSYSVKESKALHQALLNFSVRQLPETLEQLHELEHEADREKHRMIELLAAEFITPIDREDILNLAQTIDDVTDSVEDVLIRIYMFNIEELLPEALNFSTLIVECCEYLQKAIDEFPKYQKSKTLRDFLIKINQLEGEGDELYQNAMHHLYSSDHAPLYVMAWTEVLARFEKCCDACEDVADAIESAILSNS